MRLLRLPAIENQLKYPGRRKPPFSDDLGHPRPVLAEVDTYCHFATIYGRSPGLHVPAALRHLPLAGEMNRLLQQLAWESVSSYPLSGVKAIVPPAAVGQ